MQFVYSFEKFTLHIHIRWSKYFVGDIGQVGTLELRQGILIVLDEIEKFLVR